MLKFLGGFEDETRECRLDGIEKKAHPARSLVLHGLNFRGDFMACSTAWKKSIYTKKCNLMLTLFFETKNAGDFGTWRAAGSKNCQRVFPPLTPVKFSGDWNSKFYTFLVFFFQNTLSPHTFSIWLCVNWGRKISLLFVVFWTNFHCKLLNPSDFTVCPLFQLPLILFPFICVAKSLTIFLIYFGFFFEISGRVLKMIFWW